MEYKAAEADKKRFKRSIKRFKKYEKLMEITRKISIFIAKIFGWY